MQEKKMVSTDYHWNEKGELILEVLATKSFGDSVLTQMNIKPPLNLPFEEDAKEKAEVFFQADHIAYKAMAPIKGAFYKNPFSKEPYHKDDFGAKKWELTLTVHVDFNEDPVRGGGDEPRERTVILVRSSG